MKISALNISDSTAEVVTLEKPWLGKPRWASAQRIDLPDGVVENGVIHQLDRLTTSLQGQVAPGSLVMSIPEGQVYSRWLRFPAQTKLSIIRKTILEQCAEYIPYEAHEVAMDLILSGHPTVNQDVLLAAVPITIVQDYQALARALHCDLTHLELESLSSARAAFNSLPTTGAVILLDIGARTTIASWFTAGGLQFTFNVPTAGQHFTQQVQQALQVTNLQAERLKQQTGFSEKTAKPLSTAFAPIITALNEGISYVEAEWHFTTTQIVCIGGSAQLPGLTNWLNTQLHIPCVLPTELSWQSRYGSLNTSSQNPLVYLNAVGLALGQLNTYAQWPRLNFLNVSH